MLYTTMLRVSALMLALSGVATAQETATMLWTLDLHRDDYLRINATSLLLENAVSRAIGRRGDTLFVRAERSYDNTFDGAIPFSAIRTLEVGRREMSVAQVTWGPVLAGLAGGAIAGGATYVRTCFPEACQGLEGVPVTLMALLGVFAGTGIGEWYFTRGSLKWKPVILPIVHP